MKSSQSIDETKPWTLPMKCPVCGYEVVPKAYTVSIRRGSLVTTSELRFKCPKRNCGERLIDAETMYDKFYEKKK